MSEDPEDDADAPAPFEDLRDEIDSRMATDDSDTQPEPDVTDRPPLDELADSVAARDSAESVAYDELFEETETADVDTETVWKQLEANEPLTDVRETSGERRVVLKADYCDSCPYLSDPPEMTCTHEGTEILELIDLDHVAVQNCPIVKENEELEEI